jgi:phage terminase large subunit GpA-like protein
MSVQAELKSKVLSWLFPRPIPSMREWAERTIIVPDGPHKGERFDCNTQPFSRLFFDAVDSGRWDRIVATGPTQTGKSLICYVIPVLYHLFAIGETVVAGLPTMDIAQDKWAEDFLPVIEASPDLRDMLPTTGEGSRGGKVKGRVKFRNGATLRFMSGGGRDKSRAGFTGRVLAVTEVDGLDEQGATSREADKLKQMEGRLRAYLKAGIREYLECTVTTRDGRIWQEYLGGTESRIARPCPHCKAYVTPEREHLTGWQGAENELQAREGAVWTCPACDAEWTEEERYAANLRSVLVHRGQEVTPEGTVVGPAPQTRTLGFRWTAVDNHFATAADVGADEWGAMREVDRENAERELCQFIHSIPYEDPDVELTPLNADAVASRTAGLKRGIVPVGCVGVSVGVDTGKRRLHWTAIAWQQDDSGSVIDYGEQPVDADALGVDRALREALAALVAFFEGGWQTQTGEKIRPSQVWIDSGWHEHTDAVYGFCRGANTGCKPGAERYRPSKGFGEGQRGTTRYHAPKQTTTEVRYIGKEYHFSRTKRAGQSVVHVNSDHWKSELHVRLAMAPDEPGAILLYDTASPNGHVDFVDQITAEVQKEKWIKGKGTMVVWERIRRKNHYIDSSYSAVAAGHLIVTLYAASQRRSRSDGGWFAAQDTKRRR